MDKKGYSLVIVLFVAAIILLLGSGVLNISTGEFLIGNYVKDYTTAYYLAESGLQKALSLLKQNPYYEESATWLMFLGNRHSLGEGYYRVNMKRVGVDLIEINSSGKVNKAETSLKARVYLNIEIDEEIYPEPPHRNVHIKVISWEFLGPI